MSTRNAAISFVHGMNNVALPHMLGEGQAEEIRNLYLDQDGLWKDIGNPEIALDLSGSVMNGAVAVFLWTPTKVPDDCIDNFILIVVYSDGSIAAVYQTGDTWAIATVKVAARIFSSNEYVQVLISGITRDFDNKPTSAETSDTEGAWIERRYLIDSVITMTAPPTDNSGNVFYRWTNKDGDTTISWYPTITMEAIGGEYVAEYTGSVLAGDVAMLGQNVTTLLGYNNLRGADIYVQDIEPTAPNCVWIDTRGIDLILE